MVDTNLLLDTINGIPWTLLLKFSVVAIIALVLKRYYDNFASYFMFRANRDLGKNVKVVVDGQTGYITQYSWRFIYVLVESGNELVIPISRWVHYKWEICRNGNLKVEE